MSYFVLFVRDNRILSTTYITTYVVILDNSEMGEYLKIPNGQSETEISRIQIKIANRKTAK